MFEYYRIDNLISEPSSTFINLLVTFSATLLGFLGAFFIAKWTYQQQVKKDDELKIHRYKERLRYLGQLIESSISTIDKQLENFETLAKEIQEKPAEQHFLKLTASNDLQRLQNMDTSEVFQAYYQIIPDNSEKDKDYRKIYSFIDFLSMNQKQTIESTEKQVNFVYRDQLFVMQKIEQLTNQAYHWIKIIERENPDNYNLFPEYTFLISHHQNYMKLIEQQVRFKELEENFLIPFGQELLKDYSHSYFFAELHNLASEIISKFNHMKENASSFVQDLINQRGLMQNSIDSLREINLKIQQRI